MFDKSSIFDFTCSRNLKSFQKLVFKATNESDILKSVGYIKKAVKIAVEKPFKIYSSRQAEDIFLGLANSLTVPLKSDFKEKTFLHVMTSCNKVGGHTRICERWIKNSPKNEIHSLYLINQQDLTEIPKLLLESIKEKNGDVILSKSADFIEKAKELRVLASEFEVVVLHVDMQDFIPIISFGSDDFKRPVIFANHGDHLFWLGVSITDLAVNIRSISSALSLQVRGVTKSRVIDVPVEKNESKKISEKEKFDVKCSLGFSKDSKVILTIASAYKYCQRDDFYNFFKIADSIMGRDDKICLLAIGSNLKHLDWKFLKAKYKNRVCVKKAVDNSEISKFISIADFGLDSIPFSSFTSLLEIGSYVVPCATLRNAVNSFDIFDESDIVFESPESLVNHVVEVIANPNCINNFYKNIVEKCYPEKFSNNLNSIKLLTPATHKVNRDFKEDDGMGFEEFRRSSAFVKFNSIDYKKRFSLERMKIFLLWFLRF